MCYHTGSYIVSLFLSLPVSLCLPLSPFYSDVLTRKGTVGIGTVCVLVCVMRLSKLSRRGLHTDMTSDQSAGWKHSDSLSSEYLGRSPKCLFNQNSLCSGWDLFFASLFSPSVFPSLSSFGWFHLPHAPFLTPSLPPSPVCLQSAIESLFGASLTGVAYSLFAGQPLTILGSTGPVLVFEKILFKFCK